MMLGFFTPAVPGRTLTLVPFGTGTVIGDMTSGGGNAVAFNGTTSTAAASGARKNSTTTAFVGKNWGGGVTKIIGRFTVYGSSDFGVSDQASFTLKLQGSTDNFSSSVVDLYSSGSISDSNGITVNRVEADGISVSTAYQYHRVLITISTGEVYVAEAEFYELA